MQEKYVEKAGYQDILKPPFIAKISCIYDRMHVSHSHTAPFAPAGHETMQGRL